MSLGSTALSFLTGTGVFSAAIVVGLSSQGPAPEWAPLVAGGTSAGLVSALFVFVMRRTTESYERISATFAAAIKDEQEKAAKVADAFATTVQQLHAAASESLANLLRETRAANDSAQARLIEALKENRRA